MIWSSHLTIPVSSPSIEWSRFGLRRLRTRAVSAALLVLGCGLLEGCVAIPIPVARSSGPVAGSRAEVSKALPEQIVVGHTTRTDVLLLLGEPDGHGYQDRWFAYGSSVGRGGVGWSLFIATYGGAGVAKVGDWETSRRAIIHFDDFGVVSRVDFDEKNCTTARDSIGNHDCPDAGGREISSAEEAQRANAERAAQLIAAGAVLAEYGRFEWTVSHVPDCRRRELGSTLGAGLIIGDELLIAEHAILHSGASGYGQGVRPYAVLKYEDISDVRPVKHVLVRWIPILTRDGSCIYVRLLKPRRSGVSADQARALILSRISAGSTPGESESVVTPK
jgi:hypothetical protein